MSTFSFISLEGICVELPPLAESTLCRSIFLESALSAGLIEGIVPVARAEALRWYVAYLVYCDWTTRLLAEFQEEERMLKKRPTHVCERENEGERGATGGERWESSFGEDSSRSEHLIPEEPLSLSNLPLEMEARRGFTLSVDSSTTPSTESVDGEEDFEGNETARTTLNIENASIDSRGWQRHEDGATIIRNDSSAFHHSISTSPLSTFSDLPPFPAPFSPSLGTEDETWDSLIVFFLENVVLLQGREDSSRRMASYCLLYKCADDLYTSTLTLSAIEQERLLELITAADYLGDAFLTRSCARYFTSWLMQVSERDLLASFLSTRGEIMKETSPDGRAADGKRETGKVGVKAPYDTVAGERWCVPSSTSLQSLWLPLPSSLPQMAINNSSVGRISSRENLSGSGGEGDVQPEKTRNSSLLPPSVSRGDELCLSADQRLALLAEVKRTNAMFIEPYC